MSNLYVPIEYSKLSEVIPEGDDILYSTLCKGYQTIGITTVKFKTHVLITQSGLGYTAPQKKKKVALIFKKWVDVTKVKGTISGKVLIKTGGALSMGTRIRVIRDSQRESIESLHKRRGNFANFCIDLWLKHKPQEILENDN